MAPFGPQPVTRSEFARWSACAAVVLAAHGLVALAIATRSSEEDVAAGAPVVTIELAPVAVAPPAPQRDLAAGPLLETESQERVAEEAPAQSKPPEKERVVEAPPAPDPEVAMAPTDPPPEEGPIEATPRPALGAPVPTAPQAAPTPAERAAAPAVGQAPRPTSEAVATWERRLVAQLERHKRYPPQARGKVGETRLAFSIDRGGRVLASRIVHSSGSDALDAEALALIKRAAPLPAPPVGLPDERLSFVVPIRYR